MHEMQLVRIFGSKVAGQLDQTRSFDGRIQFLPLPESASLPNAGGFAERFFGRSAKKALPRAK
jgi:hypothetical protein